MKKKYWKILAIVLLILSLPTIGIIIYQSKAVKIDKTNNETLDPYLNGDQKTRFILDNKSYIENIKNEWKEINKKSEFEYDNYRPNVLRTKEAEKNFDIIANQIGIDTYENQLLKGFTVPTYDKNNNFSGLKMFTEDSMNHFPSSTDYKYDDKEKEQINGLARYLINQKYKDIGLQTYSIAFTNLKKINYNDNTFEKDYETEAGTMWILDFQKRSDEKYPTKWYFGTNVHIADLLNQNTTVGINISRLNPEAPLITKLGLAGNEQDEINFKNYSFDIKDNNINTFYKAIDFVETKPKDFLEKNQAQEFSENEEFIDFAIIEIDFEKNQNPKLNAFELAQEFTNNYANNKEKHIKFIKESYLKNYSKIDKPLESGKKLQEFQKTNDSLYALGYPIGVQDNFFDKETEKKQNEDKNNSFSLWTNASYKLYNNIKTEELDNYKNGNYLSYQIGYRSFVDKPGISDLFIASPKTAGEFYIDRNNPSYKEIYDKKTKDLIDIQYDKKQVLIEWGLNYMIKEYAPFGGASGSSVRNQNNELVGVFFGANSGAKVGLVAAFRSEGYDYKGLYGKYNLPQYDLIYGGGKEQKNGSSFRETLLKKYPNIKTNLFNDLNTIPEEFKFK